MIVNVNRNGDRIELQGHRIEPEDAPTIYKLFERINAEKGDSGGGTYGNNEQQS